MKLVFMSDIHSNIFALNAVIEDLGQEDVAKTYCLGDLVGYLPFAAETIQKIRENNIESIYGNYDKSVVGDDDSCGCNYNSKHEQELERICFRKTKNNLAEQDKEFIRNLDFSKQIKINNKLLLLFHASPDNDREYLEDSDDLSRFQKIISNQTADLYIFGHTHRPFVKAVDKKLFINCGSVGKSLKPGFAQYAMVEISKNSFSVQIMQCEYDLEKMKSVFSRSNFPKETIEAWY